MPKLKDQKLRHNEYYDMQSKFDELYAQSKEGFVFKSLVEIIQSDKNIKLAYRNIKNNSGSHTAGVDRKTIGFIENFDEETYVRKVRAKIANYNPKAVKRVDIPKPDGRTRPLGIPTIWDRIVQQCILQVLEPICEAKFYERSNGFRPNRSAENAIAQAMFYMQKVNLHYVVDIDIKGFFDNVNHAKLIRQMWSLGIQDTKLLKVVKRMLKAPVLMPDGQLVYPDKGTPQGGILSPLLSNIVLNELDWWISSQWETFPTRHEYHARGDKFDALKRNSKLKEMYIVRYADDFKIFCRTRSDAKKIFTAVEKWLNERLHLEISPEKSKIVNLKKQYSDFLGFKLKVHKKADRYTVISHISDKAEKRIENNLIEQIKLIKRASDEKERHRLIALYNSKVIGIHNYYDKATHVSIDCNRIAYRIKKVMKNRFGKYLRTKKQLLKIETESEIKISEGAYIHERYGGSKQMRYMNIYPIVPIGYVRTRFPLWKRKEVNKYTPEGRESIHKNLDMDISTLKRLMENPVSGRSVKYADNRISSYAGQCGKCYVTGRHLKFDEVHCHHIRPLKYEKNDSYENLIIVHKYIHVLIHATKDETIKQYLQLVGKENINIKKLNKLRLAVGNEVLTLDIY